MQSIILPVILGLIGGAAVGLQGPLSSLMSQRLGILESVFIVHLGGALAAGLPLLFMRGGNLSAWRSVPWYALGAGVLGLVVLSAVSITIPRLGSTATVALIVAAQLVIGVLLDYFGLLEISVRSLDLSRCAGIAALLLGTWLLVK